MATRCRRRLFPLRPQPGEPGWAIVVLALPRGGVAVAKQVAVRLDAPMSVIVTRKS